MTRAALLAVPVLAAAVAAAPPPKGDEKLPPPTPDQLKQSRENLKQIVIGMHSHFDTTGRLPNNTFTADGKPLLSWRVHLLPHLEQEALYKKFKLNEPWDSDANLKLAADLPKVYAPVRGKAKAGHTYYRGFDGPGTIFEKGKRVGLLDITDGTSNTIAVVEAGESVAWTKPDDLPFAADKELPKLGGLFDGVFHAAMCDGSVHKAKAKPDEKMLKYMIGKDDGQVVTDDVFEDR